MEEALRLTFLGAGTENSPSWGISPITSARSVFCPAFVSSQAISLAARRQGSLEEAKISTASSTALLYSR